MKTRFCGVAHGFPLPVALRRRPDRMRSGVRFAAKPGRAVVW
ncbi:MAG TPA: hypothetical protein PK440_08795 [Candidatus Accumulibacter phosphatis]|nr:MAG: hypothetical protein AW07_03093 [Candidatus Accumulibacter sp. SK-11]HRL76268.1 hypothetical protein [Candidatus Accumulibacter phosphatis]HRQ95080.1 hypothetical protein [Candidatus Accumulibacter phosphatis]